MFNSPSSLRALLFATRRFHVVRDLAVSTKKDFTVANFYYLGFLSAVLLSAVIHYFVGIKRQKYLVFRKFEIQYLVQSRSEVTGYFFYSR